MKGNRHFFQESIRFHKSNLTQCIIFFSDCFMFPISQQVQLIEKGLRNEIWHIFHGIKYDLKITLMITDTEMLNSSNVFIWIRR